MKGLLITLVLTVIVSFSVSSQFENVQYSQITARAGLPDNVVTCIFQDSKGFMWFGTTGGLARYDGYQFKVFSKDPLDTTSTTSNIIYQICEDRSGNFWVTNSSGLNKFDTGKLSFKDIPYRQLLPNSGDHSILSMSYGEPGKLYLATWSGYILELDINTETLKKIILDPGNPDFKIDDRIVDFQIASNGMAWVCTFGTGLYVFDSNDDFRLIRRYRSHEDDKLSLTTDSLATLFEDSRGDIWVTSFNGLNRITPPGRKGEKGEVQRFYREHDKANSLPDNQVFAIKEDRSGILWLRNAHGISTYSRETGQFNHWPHQYSGVNSFVNFFTAQTLLIDTLGSVWFSIGATGVSRLSFHKNKFDLIRHDPKDDNSLIDNGVSNILQDSTGVLWVATWNQGLDKRVPGKKGREARWYHYRHKPDDATSIPSNNIRTLFRDSRGDLWLGSDDAGLIKLVDAENGKVEFKNYMTDFFTNDQGNRMDVITEDSGGNLWVGGRGFFLFDRDSETFYRYVTETARPDTLPVEWVSSMAPDPSGATWLGTWSVGLVKIAPPYKRVGKYATGTTTSYKNDEGLPKDLRDWSITSILVPAVYTDVLLSIGTAGGGLFELRKNKDQRGKIKEYFTNYSVKDGLQAYYIQGVEEDARGNIWISSQDGLSKLDPVTGIIANFNVDDGLPTNEFGWLSHYTSPDGKLYYYLDGLFSFYPDSLHTNPNVPPVYITGVSINNKSFEPGENSALKTDLPVTGEITVARREHPLHRFCSPQLL
jgi:ligand-binding sensor domain-containing protein